MATFADGAPRPDALRARAAVLRAVRAWFEERGFLEIHTPVLVRSAALEEHLFPVPAADGLLRTSPEFALKRVIASGLPRVYEIGPCFRDRESGPWHGREFAMLEFYRVGADLPDLMDDVEAVIAAAASALGKELGRSQRKTIRGVVLEVTGIDLATASADEISPRDPDSWDLAFQRLWVERIEPALAGSPGLTLVRDWPAPQAALAQLRDDGEWPVAERFEAYFAGIELANGFREVIDSAEQRRRAMSVNAARLAAGEAPHPVDERFVDAVGRLPPVSGVAIGLDRLVAVLCGWDGIGPGQVPG